MNPFFRMVLVILLYQYHFDPAFVTCYLSCLDAGAVASPSSSSCCQCTQYPVSYRCPERCQYNMYPAQSIIFCSAHIGVTTITSRLPTLNLSRATLPLRPGRLATSTSGTQTDASDEGPQTPHRLFPPSRVHETASPRAGDDEERGHLLPHSPHIVPCQPCHTACNGCTGAGPGQCLRCSEGYRQLCNGADSCECVMITAPPPGRATKPNSSEHSSTHMISMISLILSSGLLVLVLVVSIVVGLLLARRRSLHKRLWMSKRKHGMTFRPAYPFPTPVDAGDDITDPTRPLSLPWNTDKADTYTLYAEIGIPCCDRCREFHPDNTSSILEDGKRTSIVQCIEETQCNLPRIAEKIPLLGSDVSPRSDTDSQWNTSLRSKSYCDYRMTTSCPDSNKELSEEETNPKLLSPETAPPFTICTAAAPDSRDRDANAPPLPPRNKAGGVERNIGGEKETTSAEMSSTNEEASSSPDTESTAVYIAIPSTTEQSGSSAEDASLPQPRMAIEKRGTYQVHNLLETLQFPDLKEQDGHTARNESGTMTYIPACHGTIESLDNIKGHRDLNHLKTSSEGEDRGLRGYLSADIMSDYLTSAKPDELCYDTYAGSSHAPLSSGTDSEVLLYSCAPRKMTEFAFNDPGAALFSDCLSGSLSSELSWQEKSSTYVCAVSNLSSSSSHDSWARPLNARQISWTQVEMYNSSVEEENTPSVYPFLAAPPSSLLPGLGRSVLPEVFLKKFQSDKDRLHSAEKRNMLSSYVITSSTQTASLGSTENCGPTFSPAWQKEQVVSDLGGTVQTDGSAVRLEIPPGAMPTGESVTIRASISTNLDQVYSKLPLPNIEHITSPVAEYFAGTHFRFCKPVKIVLPHFLPLKFSPEQVNVYVFHAGPTGELSLRKLKLRGKDNRMVQDTDVFSLVDGKSLEIFTDHFSGYLCTCQSRRVAQDLQLVLFARHMQRAGSGREVDIRLEIWDNRLEVPDFEQACFHRPRTANEENMHCIDRKSLSPPEDDVDMETVKIGCELDFRTEQESQLWSHVQRRSGQLMYPVRSAIPLKNMFPCECFRPRIPKLVDWKLTHNPAEPSSAPFGCLVDVGYILGDQLEQLHHPFTFLGNPAPVTIDVSLDPAGTSSQVQEAKANYDSYRGAMDDMSRPMQLAGPPQSIVRNQLRDGPSPTDTHLKQLPSPSPSPEAVAADRAAASLHHALSDLRLQQGHGTHSGFSDLNRTTYVCVSDLQAAGLIPERASPPDRPAMSQAGSSVHSGCGSASITIIQKAATVNFSGSMESSSAGGSSFSSSCLNSMQGMSITSSASSENAAANNAAQPRRPDNFNSQFDAAQPRRPDNLHNQLDAAQPRRPDSLHNQFDAAQPRRPDNLHNQFDAAQPRWPDNLHNQFDAAQPRWPDNLNSQFDAAQPRRPDSLNSRFEITPRAAELLAYNSTGGSGDSEHYGYPESEHSHCGGAYPESDQGDH